MTLAFQDKCPVYSMSSNKQAASTNNPTPPYPVAASNFNSNIAAVAKTPYPIVNSSQMPMPNSYIPQQTGYGNLNSGYGIQTSSNPSGYQPPYQPYTNLNKIDQAPISSLVNPSSNTAYNFNTSNYGTIQPTHIRASLISAVEDKIRSRLLDKIG